MPYPYHGPQAGDISTISLEHAQAILNVLKQDRAIARKIYGLHKKLIDEDIRRRLRVLQSGQRARPLAICIDCREALDADTSDRGSCIYHEGNLEPDGYHDIWADHDEDVGGPIDTSENREQFPEVFRWDCCEEPGDADGCHRGAHRTNERVHKSGCPVEDYESSEVEEEEDEEEDEDGEDEEDEEPEVVVVGQRQVVNKRRADDSFEVSVYTQKAKRVRW
ncbi:hypothetical protein K456DRAFT_1721227 [Colletotrichum gloeosporioides 23]|nr:hypothetical protein K456DRAFT_1721227 [Colletotrichum gloeosporioides 23]